MPKQGNTDFRHVKYEGGNKLMNLENQHLKAIQTTKQYYKRQLEEENDKEKKQIYQAMIEDLTDEEKRILAEDNILLDDLEKGDDTL